MKPAPHKSIVYYASSDNKYTGQVGIITSGFLFPDAEIKMQEVKFVFGTFWHDVTYLHIVKNLTKSQKESLEQLKIKYPKIFEENKMRMFDLGACVEHPEYKTGTIASERSPTGHYKVLLDSGSEARLHENALSIKNNMSQVEIAERRYFKIVAKIDEFLASDLAQQLTPAQREKLKEPPKYVNDLTMMGADVQADLERLTMGFINAKESNQTTNAVPASTTQQSEAVESNTQSGQEVSQAATTEVVQNPVINKNYVPVVLNLESDAKTTAPVIVFDKQVYLNQIDSMPIEDITAKWLKSIKDAAIAIDKRLNEPVAAWRKEVDEIIAYAEARIKSIKDAEAKAEAKRKELRAARANELLAECKAASDLPPEYLATVVLKNEYLLVKFTDKKIIEDINIQLETQRQLKQGADDAAAVKLLSIKNRELLIENLNAKYGVEGKYSMFPIETFTDEQVLAKYEQNHQRKLELAKIEQEQLDAENIKNEVKNEAVAENSTLPVVNASLPNASVGEQQKYSTPQANIKSSSPASNSGSTETETVIMFKLVVTGHDQATHDRIVPRFINEIKTAVDVSLVGAVENGWQYNLEVVK